MKRMLALLLAAIMVFCLVGCGENANDVTDGTTTTTAESVTTTTAQDGDTTTTEEVTTTDEVTTTTEEVTTTTKVAATTTTTKAVTTTVKTTTTTAAPTTTTTTTTTTVATTTTTKPVPTTYQKPVFQTDMIREDGTLDRSLVVMYTIDQFNRDDYFTSRKPLYDEYYTDYFTFPEAEVLKKMRETFVVSDSDFAAIKAYETYQSSESPDYATYQDGAFVLEISNGGWGGGDIYEHHPVGYTYANGVLKLCQEYMLDEDYTGNFSHVYFYEIEYTYSGTGEFKIENGAIVSTDKALIDSLRIRSIKKVTDTSAYTLKPIA